MESIIKLLEAEKITPAKPEEADDLTRAIETGTNDGVDRCIKILQTQKVIKAKAVKKQGTNRFYRFYDNLDEWIADDFVFMFYDENCKEDYFAILPPLDSKLIDITIIIPE